jgi:hypothetical protein
MIVNIRNFEGSVYTQGSADTVAFLKTFMLLKPDKFHILPDTVPSQLIFFMSGEKLSDSTKFTEHYQEVMFICKDRRLTDEWFTKMEEILDSFCKFIDYFPNFRRMSAADDIMNDAFYNQLRQFRKTFIEYNDTFDGFNHSELLELKNNIYEIRNTANYCINLVPARLIDNWASLQDTEKWRFSIMCSSLIKICNATKEEHRIAGYRDKYAEYSKFDVFP